MQKIAILDYHKWDKNLKESKKIKFRLISQKANVDIYKVMKNQLPDVNSYDKFVLSGSDDPNLLKKQSAKKSLDTVFKADSQNKKVLALCGGYELLGVVGYGMEFRELIEAECEFGQIFLRNGAKDDPLFVQIPERYSVLEVHKKIIIPKKKSKILAFNIITGGAEVIKFSKNIYGMQGHPEDTEEEATKIIRTYAKKYNLPERNRLRKTDFVLNRNDQIFKNFVNL